MLMGLSPFVLFGEMTLLDLLLGMVPITAISAGLFFFWLWRTQRTLPQTRR
jgi:hypothetical protein